MPIPLPENCPHETRPGTVVCLHCRHDALMAIRAERQRKIGRVFVALVIVGVLGAAASAGAAAMQSRWDWKEVLPTIAANFGTSSAERGGRDLLASNDPVEQPAATPVPAADSAAQDSTALDSLAVGAGIPDSSLSDSTAVLVAFADSASIIAPSDSQARASSPSAGVTPAAPAVTPAPAVPRLAPVVAEGRTELGDSVFALREGSVVTVHFDTPMGRTRRRDKFESMVRRTLPKIYGAAADSALVALPAGSLTGAGDLLTELPANGIRLALSNGATLSIWPRTRPGRDGPLVVAYRAIVSR